MMTKVFVVLTTVLAIALSCFFVSAAAQWDNWRSLAKTYQQLQEAEFTHRMNLTASMQAELAMKTDTLNQKSNALAAAQDKIKELAANLEKMQSDLTKAKNEAIAFEASRKKIEEILSVTTGERGGLQKQNQELLTQNIDLQTRNSRLNGRVLELTANVTILTDQVRNLQEKNYSYEQQLAGRSGAAPTAPSAAQPVAATGAVPTVARAKGPISGQVTEVDGNYASINVGENSGVIPGMTFMIYREGVGYVGDLTIEGTVRPKEAGGKLTTLVKGPVQRGDAVELVLR